MEISNIQIQTPTDNCTVVGSLEDGSTAIFNVASLRAENRYVIKGLLTQVGLAAPVITTIYSNITTAISTSRVDEGVYRITCTNAFTLDKTFWTFTPTTSSADAATFLTAERIDANSIEVRTFSEDGTLGDDLLTKASFSIEIY